MMANNGGMMTKLEKMRKGREVCQGCKQEIDPEVCWCGELLKDHGFNSNHSAIPMGCRCYMEEIENG